MSEYLLFPMLILIRLLEGLLVLALTYHYLLAIASASGRNGSIRAGQRKRSFCLVIPAHNEETVIASTIECAKQLNYPSGKYDVHVIADHCSDRTGDLARAEGATVHVRSEEPSGRKGYALAWGFNRLLKARPPYDAFVVLDADTCIDGEFLNVMDDGLSAGYGVLQGQRIVSNSRDSVLAALAAVDQRLNNSLRNQARTNLGWSCRLMGDAMCFAREIIEKNPWHADSLVEDREYGAQLLLSGIRVRYVPGAIVRQQAAVSLRSGQQQRLRWYRGAVEVQNRLARQLIWQGLLRRDMALLDGGIELLMPAYSTLAMFALLMVLIECLPSLGRNAFSVILMSVTLVAWIVYPVLGLWLDRAPLSMYRTLLIYGPVYAIWRVWLALVTRALGKRIQWVRTQRREEMRDLVSRDISED